MSFGSANGSAPLVHCQQAGRTYGSGRVATVALHGATASVFPGARIAITGPSGSGKTTLLHLMAGLDDPTAGSVTWPAIGTKAALRPGPVAMIFQGPSLLPPLTVLENVALPLQLLGRSQDEAVGAARDALAQFRIGELADKLPEEISGGQAQRAAVARVLASNPRLILADEPTGQLDKASAAMTVAVLVEAAERTGAALVVSTHDLAVAAQLTEHWEMADGRLSGTKELVSSP